MSNDDNKTWPENIWVDTVGEQLNNIHLDSWYISSESSPLCPDELHYIRADIAKEREEKLILIAAAHGYLTADPDWYPGDCDMPLIYKDAGLEKLK